MPDSKINHEVEHSHLGLTNGGQLTGFPQSGAMIRKGKSKSLKLPQICQKKSEGGKLHIPSGALASVAAEDLRCAPRDGLGACKNHKFLFGVKSPCCSATRGLLAPVSPEHTCTHRPVRVSGCPRTYYVSGIVLTGGSGFTDSGGKFVETSSEEP